MSAIETLRGAYRDRLGAAHRAAAAGGKVIGLIGAVPVELVDAAGCFAVQLTAEPDGPTDLAERYMEELHERETRALFDRVLRGDFDFCAAIVVSSASDSHRYLFHYIKEVVRQGVRDSLPPVISFDLMFGELPAIRRYGLERTRELANRLGLIAGKAVDDAALAGPILAARRRRDLLDRLDRLRSAGRLSGTDAFQCIGAGRFMAPAEYEACLANVVAEAESRPAAAAARRVLVVPSAPLYHDRLHRLIEAAGAGVVAEDDGWGARGFCGAIPERPSPLDAIFEAYHETTASPRAPRAKREAWLRRRLAAGGIDGVVIYVPPSDQDFGWSYPDLREALEARRLPSLLLRDDVLDRSGAERIAIQLAAFLP